VAKGAAVDLYGFKAGVSIDPGAAAGFVVFEKLGPAARAVVAPETVVKDKDAGLWAMLGNEGVEALEVSAEFELGVATLNFGKDGVGAVVYDNLRLPPTAKLLGEAHPTAVLVGAVAIG